MSTAHIAALAVLAFPLPAFAYTQPFTFHCRGDACRSVAFLDEGNGCTIVTNYSRRNVRVTQGANADFVLAPGETHGQLQLDMCAGYYDGGETATFE